MNDRGPRSQRAFRLRELAALTARNRTLLQAMAQAARADDAPTWLQEGAAQLRRGEPAHRALAALGPWTSAERALLDLAQQRDAWTTTLRYLADRDTALAQERAAWFAAVVWPCAALAASLVVAPLPGLVRLGTAPPTWPALVVALGVACALAWLAPRALGLARRLPGTRGLDRARWTSRVLEGLAASLHAGAPEPAAWQLAARLARDEPHGGEPYVNKPHVNKPHVNKPHVNKPHVNRPSGVRDSGADRRVALRGLPPRGDDAHGGPRAPSDAVDLPDLGAAARQSLATAGPALAGRAERLGAASRERWQRAHRRRCRAVTWALALAGLAVVLWVAASEVARIAAAGLPDGQIMHPERIEERIDAAR